MRAARRIVGGPCSARLCRPPCGGCGVLLRFRVSASTRLLSFCQYTQLPWFVRSGLDPLLPDQSHQAIQSTISTNPTRCHPPPLPYPSLLATHTHTQSQITNQYGRKYLQSPPNLPRRPRLNLRLNLPQQSLINLHPSRQHPQLLLLAHALDVQIRTADLVLHALATHRPVAVAFDLALAAGLAGACGAATAMGGVFATF